MFVAVEVGDTDAGVFNASDLGCQFPFQFPFVESLEQRPDNDGLLVAKGTVRINQGVGCRHWAAFTEVQVDADACAISDSGRLSQGVLRSGHIRQNRDAGYHAVIDAPHDVERRRNAVANIIGVDDDAGLVAGHRCLSGDSPHKG